MLGVSPTKQVSSRYRTIRDSAAKVSELPARAGGSGRLIDQQSGRLSSADFCGLVRTRNRRTYFDENSSASVNLKRDRRMPSVHRLKNFGGAPTASLSGTAPAGRQRQASL